MNIPWKLIVFIAVVVTAGLVAFDLFFALEGEETLIQYQVSPIQPTIGEDVLRHLADISQDNLLVRSNELDQN